MTPPSDFERNAAGSGEPNALPARRWAIPLVLLAVAAVCARKFGNGFVYDDNNLIVRGRIIHDPSRALEVFTHSALWAANGYDIEAGNVDTYRPISILSFFWDAACSGLHPWSYHLTNLVVHLACTYLVYLLARRLLPAGSRGFAPVAAAFFGLHPQLAEAHVWINGRSDPLCVLFGVSAVLVWDAANEAPTTSGRRARGWALSSALFLLGLMSKEVLVGVLPALFLWPTRDPRRDPMGARALATLPFVAASAMYLVLRGNALGAMATHSGEAQLTQALARYPLLLLDGLVHAIAPVDLYLRSMRDDYAAIGVVSVVLAALLAVAVGVACFALRRRLPLLAWSAAWFAVPLAPVSVITTILWPGFGRYLYLPMVAFAVVLAACAGYVSTLLDAHGARVRPLATLALWAYLATLALALSGYITDYRDEEQLYRAIVREAPQRAHGHGWLGMHLSHVGRPRDAMPAFARASELDPQEPRYLLGYGTALLSLGERARALAVAERGVATLSPPTEFHMLAAASLLQSDAARARQHTALCLRRQPAHAVCRDLARALAAPAPR